MDKFGVNTQKWRLTEQKEGALEKARELNAVEYVIKAQVHAGGRGKGHFPESGLKGGVHVISSYVPMPSPLYVRLLTEVCIEKRKTKSKM